MLTRGHFIGEIVDAFSELAAQLDTRGRLGLTDLNIHIENFLATSLNLLLDLSLESLNADRSNAPGLDLGDRTKGWAFQVTSQRTSAKINDTLAAITDRQLKIYKGRIRVLVAGRKQDQYSLNPTLCERVGFAVRDVWDFDDLCRRCLDLPIDTLQLLYQHVQSEFARVKIELEIPDAEGRYPTSIADHIETIPRPSLSDLRALNAALEKDGQGEDLADTVRQINELSANLAKLPRITRDFLATMIERSEYAERAEIEFTMMMNVDVLNRIVRYTDKDGELRILTTYGFIELSEPDEDDPSGHWRIQLPPLNRYWVYVMRSYAKAKGISLQRFLVSLDFRDF